MFLRVMHLSGCRFVALHQLESEMRLFKNEVAARKLRQLGEASERERVRPIPDQ